VVHRARVLTRLSLLVSFLTSVGTLLLSVVREQVSTPWLLGSATLVCVLCLGLVLLDARRSSAEANGPVPGLTSAASLVALAAAWLLAYRADLWLLDARL
jgi:hypothetical protein